MSCGHAVTSGEHDTGHRACSVNVTVIAAVVGSQSLGGAPETSRGPCPRRLWQVILLHQRQAVGSTSYWMDRVFMTQHWPRAPLGPVLGGGRGVQAWLGRAAPTGRRAGCSGNRVRRWWRPLAERTHRQARQPVEPAKSPTHVVPTRLELRAPRSSHGHRTPAAGTTLQPRAPCSSHGHALQPPAPHSSRGHRAPAAGTGLQRGWIVCLLSAAVFCVLTC